MSETVVQEDQDPCLDSEVGSAEKSRELPYGDSKRSYEYSSEDHKLEIFNLKGNVKYHAVKSLLEKQLKIEPRKIRVGQKRAFVGFRTEQERDDAIVKINNYTWKDRVLSAKPASARYDPFVKRHKTEDDQSQESNDDTECDVAKSINDQVCPLWQKDYDHQLKFKSTTMRSILNIGKQLHKVCPSMSRDSPQLFKWTQENPKISCPFDGVEPSPVIMGYRNKCEFNVGSDGTVGFRTGRYKNGSATVVEVPRDCPIVSETMIAIVDSLQVYFKDKDRTKLSGFDTVTHEGNLRQVTLRTNRKDEVLVIIDIHPQDLSQSQIDFEIESIISMLKQNTKIISIFFNISEKSHMADASQTLKLVYGQDHLDEFLEIEPKNPLKFRIGPTSFFQVNTKGAELLYRAIVEFAQLNAKSLVLDVGCGTGTISLSLAKRVYHVIGIEIVKSAVEDAKINARENNITNVDFIDGKAEDLIWESINILRDKNSDQNKEGEIVAIVDPPRVGFNNSFIKTLRASNIKKIIYIACDPKANTNLVSLCRPKSKAYQGDPFVPTRAKAFDLFPHTKFCELLLLYERLVEPVVAHEPSEIRDVKE